MRMGMQELLVIFGILILLFGAKRLPQLADGMGKAIRNFKKGLHTDDSVDVTPPHGQVAESSSATEMPNQAAPQPAEHKS